MALAPSRLPLPVSPPAPDFFSGGRSAFADFFADFFGGASDSSADSSFDVADLDDLDREEAREERSCSESESGTMKSSSPEAVDFFLVAVDVQIDQELNL